MVLAPLAAGLLLLTCESHAQQGRTVQVQVRLQRDGEVADVFVQRDGAWSFACRTPCSFDAAPGEQVRIDVLGFGDEPIGFTVQSNPGKQDIAVGRRGRGYLVGGLAAIGAGAITLALGMAIIRGAGDDDLFGEANRWVARAMLLLGGGSVVAGGALVVTRSTGPMILPPPPTPIEPRVAAPLQLTWTTSF